MCQTRRHNPYGYIRLLDTQARSLGILKPGETMTKDEVEARTQAMIGEFGWHQVRDWANGGEAGNAD